MEREEQVFGNSKGNDIDLEEIIFLARNVWRAKSAFSETAEASMEKGLTRSMAKLHFTRCAILTRQPPSIVATLIKHQIQHIVFSLDGTLVR